MKVIKLFYILPIAVLRAGHRDFELPLRKSIVVDILVSAIEHMGYESSSNLYIIYSAVTKKSSQRQTSIINNILLETTQHFLVSLDDIRYFQPKHSEKRDCTLLLIDSIGAFERMDLLLQSRLYDTNGKHLILLSEDLNTDKTLSLIQKVFDEFFRNYIVNVEFLVRNETTGFMEFYTYFPLSPEYCFKVIPILHYVFDDSLEPKKGLELFPRKLDNFYGCPIKVATFPYQPHIILKHNKDKVEGTGTDIDILSAIAEKLNFSVLILDGLERGLQHPNGTLTGAIRMLYESEANMTIGSYSSAAKVMKLFSPSIAYYHTALIFAIPPLQEYSPLEKLLLPFDTDVWVAIGLTFGLTILTMIVLNTWKKSYRDLVFGRTVRNPIFEMIVVYLGGAVVRFPTEFIARNVILQWLIVSVVLSSCYKAVLFVMLEKGFLKKYPSTLEEMLDEGFVIDAPSPLMQNLRDGPLGSRKCFFLMQNDTYVHYALLQTGTVKRMVVDTTIKLQHYNSIHYGAGILNSLPQRLFIFPMYIYYRKESFLVKPIDEVLKKFIQSGLTAFWHYSVQNVSHLKESNNIMKPLEVKHFQSCFALCGVLIACSIVALILEVLSLKAGIIKKILLRKQSIKIK